MTETGSISEENTGSTSPSSSAGSSQLNGNDFRKRGKCKWFNVAKGWGFITPEDGSQEVFVHQSVIQMTGFRSLGDDELVEFEFKESDKGIEATLVKGVDGGDCKGSHRRPAAKKKVKKIRCYNCGDLSRHIASKCSLGPQPKRCHSCKSDQHLIADCPKRIDRNKNNTQMKNGNPTTTKVVNGSCNGNGELSPQSIISSEPTNLQIPSDCSQTETKTIPSNSC